MSESHETPLPGMINNAVALCHLFYKAMHSPLEIRPRGEVVREIGDAQIVLDPRYPFQGFLERKYNYDYFKEEMRWKLGANRYDESIKAHAKMWEAVQNPDGTFNSNYGVFWFGEQKGFWTIVEELVRDRDSRRAVIPMLSREHMTPETTDTVCTEAVGFRIRDDKLYMSVHMRSSDQIFGLGTDVPTFSTLFMMVHGMLQPYYQGLRIGDITITAMSSHIYERHFKMVNAVIEGFKPEEYSSPRLPAASEVAEVMAMIAHRGKRQPVPSHWKLYQFIYGAA
jgi:thymidylate synthase